LFQTCGSYFLNKHCSFLNVRNNFLQQNTRFICNLYSGA
jgi:hypothetical protein